MSKLTAASVAKLCEIKDVTEKDAVEIRTLWRTKANRRRARDLIDAILCTYGVEFLGIHRRTGQDVYYCNAGDSYATTVIFHGDRLYVGCTGDLVERNRIKPPEY